MKFSAISASLARKSRGSHAPAPSRSAVLARNPSDPSPNEPRRRDRNSPQTCNTGDSQMSLVQELRMSDTNRLFFLRIALVAVGLIFIVGIYPLSILWPSGWVWGHGHSHYLMMIIGVYATLGVFLLIASRDPSAHKSLIWF